MLRRATRPVLRQTTQTLHRADKSQKMQWQRFVQKVSVDVNLMIFHLPSYGSLAVGCCMYDRWIFSMPCGKRINCYLVHRHCTKTFNTGPVNLKWLLKSIVNKGKRQRASLHEMIRRFWCSLPSRLPWQQLALEWWSICRCLTCCIYVFGSCVSIASVLAWW